VRIRARRRHQIAAVATARKMAVLVWHLLAKDADYLWARPALVARKLRALELQAGRPMKKATSRRSGTRRWRSPNRPSMPMSTSWAMATEADDAAWPEPHR
jgi:hypothetical protein